MYRILIADDEPIERQVVYKKITKHYKEQAEVFLAENGLLAVESFFEHDCQVAVLDIEMPGMTGLEAAEEIRKKNKDCSIIFLTAFDEFSYAKKAIEVRALDYLLKPGSDEDLIAVIDEAFSIADKVARGENTENADASLSPEDAAKMAGDGDANVSNSLVREAGEYIRNHYKEDISLQDVAGVLGYSDVYFCKLFKQNFGKNFISYLNEFRMNRAKELLADPMINIKDVSTEAGYRDANYFTRVFKRMVGVTPSEYRSEVTGS
ncbi:MAG: response regulator [Butyrivibrio sp.]|nr:response regulator [Butyrivibrio sp.]